MKKQTYFAPAKLILFGEHAVLRGFPCLVVPYAPLGLTLTVEASDTAQIFWNGIELSAKDAPIITKMQNLLPKQPDEKSYASFSFTTEAVAGAGLGSSAMVASVLAQWAVQNNIISEKDEEKVLLAMETAAHGRTSGIDALCVHKNQTLWAEKGETTPIQMPTWLKNALEDEIELIFTGKPAETTAEMVQKLEKVNWVWVNWPTREEILHKHTGKARLKQIMNEAGETLETRGAAPEKIAEAHRHIRRNGACVKLCGAGGFKDGGGYGLLWV